jgi:hypothetical protein
MDDKVENKYEAKTTTDMNKVKTVAQHNTQCVKIHAPALFFDFFFAQAGEEGSAQYDRQCGRQKIRTVLYNSC